MYYNKYLKYKNKYLKLKYTNKVGGALVAIGNHQDEKRFLNAIIDEDKNEVQTKTYIESKDDHLKILPKTVNLQNDLNMCLTAKENAKGTKFTMTECKNEKNQEFNIKKIIDNNYVLSLGINNNLCIDANYKTPNELHAWTCHNNNKAQQWKEVVKFNNIVSDNGEITPNIQSLILAYSDITNIIKDECDDDYFSEAIQIAIAAKNILNDNIQVNDNTPLTPVYCPLIWKALTLLGVIVPTYWTIYSTNSNNQPRLDILANKLSKIPGWKNYAVYCLMTDFTGIIIPNDCKNQITIKEGKRIKDYLFTDNKLY